MAMSLWSRFGPPCISIEDTVIAQSLVKLKLVFKINRTEMLQATDPGKEFRISICRLLCTAANPTSNKFEWSADRLTMSVVDVCKYNCTSSAASGPGALGGANDLMVIQCNASNAHGYVFTNGYINVFGQLTLTRPATRSSAIAEGPRDASCQLKSCQLPRNSAETTYTTSPDRIDGMKLEI